MSMYVLNLSFTSSFTHPPAYWFWCHSEPSCRPSSVPFLKPFLSGFRWEAWGFHNDTLAKRWTQRLEEPGEWWSTDLSSVVIGVDRPPGSFNPRSYPRSDYRLARLCWTAATKCYGLERYLYGSFDFKPNWQHKKHWLKKGSFMCKVKDND